MTSTVATPNTKTSVKTADTITTSHITAKQNIKTTTKEPPPVVNHDTTMSSTNTLNKTATPAELPPVAIEPAIAVPHASKSTWHTMLENPLQSLLAALVVALLAFSFTSFNINIGRLDNRIDRLDDSIATLDNKLDGMNLRLTALIAHLGVTDQVNIATSPPATNP